MLQKKKLKKIGDKRGSSKPRWPRKARKEWQENLEWMPNDTSLVIEFRELCIIYA